MSITFGTYRLRGQVLEDSVNQAISALGVYYGGTFDATPAPVIRVSYPFILCAAFVVCIVCVCVAYILKIRLLFLSLGILSICVSRASGKYVMFLLFLTFPSPLFILLSANQTPKHTPGRHRCQVQQLVGSRTDRRRKPLGPVRLEGVPQQVTH